MSEIKIVFDGPPGPESGRFVEVEQDGRSIRFGRWEDGEDGYWYLVIPDHEAALAAARREVEAITINRSHWAEKWKAEYDRAEKAEAERDSFQKSEKELSDAYLRIRTLVNAWDTTHGGEDRFTVTENAIKKLKAERDEAVKKLDALVGIICHGEPLAWAAGEYMEEAAAWERELCEAAGINLPEVER